MYLYITARTESEKHLIHAECMAFTGVAPDERGIALSELEVDVSRAAYIKSCVRLLIHACDLPELYKKLEKIRLSSDQFRVSVTSLPSDLTLDSKGIMYQVGARIDGKPNLSRPQTTFLVIATADKIYLGQILSITDRTWEAHSQKMYQYSSSLPTRLARAMVNLVAIPGDKIIDPCCGAGTILIEASSIVIKAVGCDINPKMAKASYKNLRHFNLEGMVLLADARNIKGSFNAVVTDLPYGRNCPSDERLCYEILQNIKSLAPKVAIVTSEDISPILLEIGYNVKKIIPVPKTSLIRYIHVGEVG
jgi:putative methyltransferase (TIGR01177 family)